MALISMRQMLDHAAEFGYGVPAFNVNNLEQMRAIMEAADKTDSPVIVQASAGARKYAGAPFLRHLILAAIVGSVTPIDDIGKMVNIGTLLAFVIVCIAITVLRKKDPNRERPFPGSQRLEEGLRLGGLPLPRVLVREPCGPTYQLEPGGHR